MGSSSSTVASQPTNEAPKMELVDWKKVYRDERPPPFGRELLKYYMIDPKYINLNNGSYGSTPKPVFQASYELNVEIEGNPDKFHRLIYQDRLLSVRTRLASLLGAKRDEVVLVTNASVGVNTVLRNFEWEEGDIIFAFSTTYGSVARTVQYLSEILPHPTLHVLQLDFPLSHADIIAKFTSFIEAHPAPPNKRRVAVIDSIVSNPGVRLPWPELVKICKEEQIWSVVDAAHSIGQETNLDLHDIDPDFWISNCHKWLSAKRSCAVLYVPERNHHVIKSTIPTSHSYVSPEKATTATLVDQFEWNGTIDWAPFLTVADALDFRAWLGGEEAINTYCHDLAVKGGNRLAEILGTKVMESPNGELTVNMTNVQLPLPSDLKWTPALHKKINEKMQYEQGSYTPEFYHNNAWWTRCSAQVYNDMSDFENVGKMWVKVCKEILEEEEASKTA